MFSIRPAEAQIALETWTRENRGVVDPSQPSRVTREEFEGLFSLFQASKPLEDLGGLPFAIVSTVIEEPKPEMRTGAARVRVSTPNLTSRVGRFDNLLSEQDLGLSDNQG